MIIAVMNTLLKDLNPDQQKAVLAAKGPVMVLAGAGSGKTRVLTYRAAHLISQGIPPENILLVTFTNKAANEMKERVSRLLRRLEPQASNLKPGFAGTFHSFCARFLRRQGQVTGLSPRFTIYDQSDSLAAVRAAIKSLNISTKNTNPRAVQSYISSAKNELINPQEYESLVQTYFQEQVAKIYPEYQKILQAAQALDFDDLLFKTVKLLESHSDILKYYQNQYQYLLVDEYQDVNTAQYILTKLLAQNHQNLFVVGDASQAIYSFRGADFRNLLKLKKDFPNIQIINLEQNYRSTQKILDAAHAVITQNSSHPILKLWTKNHKGENIKIYQALNESDEADFITSQILEHDRLSDCAVLYRTNAQSRTIEEALLRQGLAYILVGGTRFYERREIKDLLAYLKIIANLNDTIAVKRALTIGKKRFNNFNHWLEKIDKEKLTQKYSTLDLLQEIFKATGYLQLYDENDPEDRARLENIKELGSVAAQFPDLFEFLEQVALMENSRDSRNRHQIHLPDHKIAAAKTNGGAITLMTLHAAKGLEFPNVFIVGMEEGLFPHSRSLENRFELEEERRLCYVGITRAKEKLYLTHTLKRLYFGRTARNLPSRFLDSIPQKLIDLI